MSKLVTDLGGKNEFQMEGHLSAQRIYKIHRLLPLDLSWNPSDNILDLDDNLEDLDIGFVTRNQHLPHGFLRFQHGLRNSSAPTTPSPSYPEALFLAEFQSRLVQVPNCFAAYIQNRTLASSLRWYDAAHHFFWNQSS